MVDELTMRKWAYRGLFVVLAGLAVFVQVLPFRIGSSHFPGPDPLPLLAFAWVLRRPEYMPAPLLAGVILATDIMFMRPIGLWAGLSVLGLEYLRGRGRLSRDLPFALEWFQVTGVLLAMTFAEGLILAILLVEQPPIGQTGLRLLISAVCYPVIVLLSASLLGVRQAAPGEMDDRGQRA